MPVQERQVTSRLLQASSHSIHFLKFICPPSSFSFHSLTPNRVSLKTSLSRSQGHRSCVPFVAIMAPTRSNCFLSFPVGFSILYIHHGYANKEAKSGIIIYENHMELLTVLINILNNLISFQNKTYILSTNAYYYQDNISVLHCPAVMSSMREVDFFSPCVWKCLFIPVILSEGLVGRKYFPHRMSLIG